MKILVLSDSHGRKAHIEHLLKNSDYSYVFYLGDGLNDISNFNEKNILKVAGNCDLFSTEPITRIESILNTKIMLTHGHAFKAKFLIEPMVFYAKENNCSLLCFGHTHKQKYEVIDGVTVVNPGSLKNGNYAVIYLEKNKDIKVELKTI